MPPSPTSVEYACQGGFLRSHKVTVLHLWSTTLETWKKAEGSPRPVAVESRGKLLVELRVQYAIKVPLFFYTLQVVEHSRSLPEALNIIVVVSRARGSLVVRAAVETLDTRTATLPPTFMPCVATLL